ncbi:MAG: hypothetical protein QM487_09135 [Candidatus Marithrix sp.]
MTQSIGEGISNVDVGYEIKKQLIYDAYLGVKANKGSCGVDEQSLSEFEQDQQSL